MSRARLAAGALCLAVVASATGPVAAAGPANGPPAASVRADFSRSLNAHSLVGFLHGLDPAAPSRRWVEPLHPTLWRGTPSSVDYDRARSFGARYVLVLSDLWGYPGSGWNGRLAPWTELDAWRAFVRGVARANRGRHIVWDIWNEPDDPYFWSGTQAQYHAVFRTAEHAIRAELGAGAVVAGPGVSAFRLPWLTGLLDYCLARSCRVNVLSWHELPPESRSVTTVERHLVRARRSLLANPRYRRLGLRRIYVTETIGRGDSLAAGEQVAMMSALERGGADAAARACWKDPSGPDSCANATLDGLLDSATLRPRAAWWALKWYARGVGSRVRSSSSGSSMAVLAAARAPSGGDAEILIGRINTHTRGASVAGRDVRVVLDGLRALPRLRGAHTLRVRAWRVGSVGERPVVPRPFGGPWLVPVRRGRAQLTLRGVAVHDAILVRVSHS